MHLPPNIPAKDFWSFVVYDNQTRSMLRTTTAIPQHRQRRSDIVINADASVDVWFGPTAPEGHEANWVQTLPGKGWNVLLRLYGPLESWFDKTWKPSEIEPSAPRGRPPGDGTAPPTPVRDDGAEEGHAAHRPDPDEPGGGGQPTRPTPRSPPRGSTARAASPSPSGQRWPSTPPGWRACGPALRALRGGRRPGPLPLALAASAVAYHRLPAPAHARLGRDRGGAHRGPAGRRGRRPTPPRRRPGP